MFFNFWRPSRYCSSSNHYVLRDSQQFRLISEGVASVPAVYQFLSVEQKSKVIFVPRSFTNLFFIGILICARCTEVMILNAFDTWSYKLTTGLLV
nr:hypothetical protein [Enterococcus faecalis]